MEGHKRHRNRGDRERLETGMCEGTKPISNAGKELAALGKGMHLPIRSSLANPYKTLKPEAPRITAGGCD